MKECSYKVIITAPSEQEADQKILAFATLMPEVRVERFSEQCLKDNHLAEEKPSGAAPKNKSLADLLNQPEKLGEILSVLGFTPEIISPVIKVLNIMKNEETK